MTDRCPSCGYHQFHQTAISKKERGKVFWRWSCGRCGWKSWGTSDKVEIMPTKKVRIPDEPVHRGRGPKAKGRITTRKQDMDEHALEAIKRVGAEKPLEIGAIIDVACKLLGVSVPELAGSGRHPLVVLARRLIVGVARRRTLCSYPSIAKAMGKSEENHSALLEALARLTDDLDKTAGEVVGPNILGDGLEGLTVRRLMELVEQGATP